MAGRSAVILAGGLGSRIRHLLGGRPKPLAPVAGKPFLEWILRFLVRQGVSEMIISAGYRADMIRDFCSSASLPGVQLRSVTEATPQGTAGGFLEAIASTRATDTWLVCNGDSLVCADLTKFFAEFDDTSVRAALIALEVEDSGRYGNLRCDPERNLMAFNEKSAESRLINGGIYLFRRDVLQQFPAKRPLSFETDVFPALLDRGLKIRVHEVAAPFIDIGTEASLTAAESFIHAHQDSFV